MNKNAVKRAVASSREKLLGDIEDPEVKKKAERALNDCSLFSFKLIMML